MQFFRSGSQWFWQIAFDVGNVSNDIHDSGHNWQIFPVQCFPGKYVSYLG